MTSPTSPTPLPPSAALSPTVEDALPLVLDPVGAQEFLAGRWGRAPLRVPRREPGRFDSVLSLADVERLACASGLRVPALRLVRDGSALATGSYTVDIPWAPGNLSATARPERIAAEFASGATLVLQALHIHWLPAALFCRGLEKRLRCPVQANSYYTPASAQGFAVHHDTHDVFVLQVAGSKRWRVYAPVMEAPLRDQKFTAEMRERAGEPVDDFELEPGDTLYLPRGWPHEAFTSDGESLHITVGLHPPSRMDALRDALAECAQDPHFRLPLNEGLPERDLAEALIARLGDDEVSRRAHRRFVRSRRPILPDQITQMRLVAGLGGDDVVRRRETVIALLEDGPTLVFEGREVVFPTWTEPAVRWLYERGEQPLSVREIPGLDDESAVVLVRRLVHEGFLRIEPR